jgi:hypothetical protein
MEAGGRGSGFGDSVLAKQQNRAPGFPCAHLKAPRGVEIERGRAAAQFDQHSTQARQASRFARDPQGIRRAVAP